MPKIWRYLLSQYLKFFALSTFSLLAILLVARFREIASCAAMTGDWAKTALFASCLIPLLLPIALPISSLIASFLLFRTLSRNHELTALRASGWSLTSLFLPLLFASILFSAAHFVLSAELAPYCRRESQALLYRETSTNPLLLLQRQRLIKIPDIFLQMKVKEEGQEASDLLLVFYSRAKKGLCLFSAKKLRVEGTQLTGEGGALIATKETGELLIENEGFFSMASPLLADAVQKNRPTLDTSALNIRMLRLRGGAPWYHGKTTQAEILRRLTLSLSMCSFPLLGFAFGIDSERKQGNRGLVKAVALALLVLVCYLLGKALKQNLLYILPHLIAWGYSLLHLRKISRGNA
jgi:lipopolysaccharide export LptBFGC system permease protein LptF